MKKKRSRKARLKRTSSQEDLDRGIQASSAGRLSEAEKFCRRALNKSPGWPLALHKLAVIRFQQGEKMEAASHLQEAIRRDPDYAAAYNDLGNILHEVDQFDEAITCLRRFNELQPDQPIGLNNLAVILKDQERVDEAVTLLLRAIKLDPTYLSAHLNLAYAYCDQERYQEAIEVFEASTLIAPDNTEPLRMLAQLYRQAGDDAKTMSTYERWRVLEPNCEIAKHMFVAHTTPEVSTRATTAFVRDEFDRFADSFDKNLAKLNYRAPDLVLAEVTRRFPDAANNLEILDAGCGTGQVGTLLRPHARRLVGVDLSAAMLAHARRAGAYDELVEQELVEYLEQQSDAFDLITVVDTFIYFGDLHPPLVESWRALRPGGSLIFTVEAANEPVGFRLTRTGRYVHCQDYVESCMEKAGFAQHEISSVQIREERNEPVLGYLVWGTRP